MTARLLAPPVIAERLLRLSIHDPEWRDAVSGDLREEFSDQVRRRGRRAASRWYWSQALRLFARFTAGRLIPAMTPARRSLADDIETGRGMSIGWLGAFRHAWRGVWRRPALSGVIVGTLALALAANATLFTLVDAIYLRPFRFADLSRLVLIMSAPDDPYANRQSVAPADLRDWTRDSRMLRELAAADDWDPNLSEVDEPEQLPGFRVSPGFFHVLGVEPVLGRTFLDEEGIPGDDRRAIISHTLWVRRYGSDPSIVGRSIRLNGVPHEVVGVMPPGLAVPYGAQVWAPMALDDAAWSDRRRARLLVVGRLADGKTLGQAAAEMRTLVARQQIAYPDTNRNREVTLMTFTRGLSDSGSGPVLALWQGAAILLLLVACANIANLLLARGTEREQEFAVRLALGAGRGRLAGQVLIEGLWLAVAAFVIAIPLAVAGTEATRHGLPPSVIRYVPGYEYLRVDLAALAVMAGLGVFATLAFSVLPALHASRWAPGDSLRHGSRSITPGGRRPWVRTVLAATQVSVSVALIAASGLILGAVDRAVNGALGFDKSQLMTAELTLPEKPYADDWRRRRFVAQVLDRLKQVPAIESAATTSGLPYDGSSTSRPFYPEGAGQTPADARRVDLQRATPAFLNTIRVPLLEGRGLTDADTADTRPVALVSRGLAERYWPARQAIGQRFRTAADAPWIEIVGIVGDVTQDWFGNQRRPTVYRPVAQDVSFSMTIVVHTFGNPLDVAGEIRRAVAAADPDQPILLMRTMEQVVADKVGGITYLARALAVMSGIALVLAVMGVYSLMAFLAARKTQEIGVRMALGATRWQVIRLNMSEAGVITASGLAAGGAMAIGVGRLMGSVMYGLVTLEIAPLVVAVLAIGAFALAAAFVPARRAARLDPTVALRAD